MERKLLIPAHEPKRRGRPVCAEREMTTMKNTCLPILLAVLLISSNAQAGHSNNSSCGNGHLGIGDDCSGTSGGDGSTVYGAPATVFGKGIAGGLLSLVLLGFAYGRSVQQDKNA